MKKKLYMVVLAGSLFTALMLSGCGTNDDEQNPPPQDRIQNERNDMDKRLDENKNDPNINNEGRVDEDGRPEDADNKGRVNPNNDEGLMRDKNGNKLDRDRD